MQEYSHVVEKHPVTTTIGKNRDKNFICDSSYEDIIIKELYDNCKNDIQKIRSENPSPKLKEANINVIKEASMKLTTIYNSLYITTVAPYFWYDEIPTLTSSSPMQVENIKRLQPLLNQYFKVSPKTKEEFIFNTFMLSFNDRNGEFSELHKILEYYLMNTYEDYKWFKENLSNIDLIILEQYPYITSFKTNEKYNSLNDEDKKDAIYFYCGQIILSSMSNPSHTTKLTREKIKEEILKLTETPMQKLASEIIKNDTASIDQWRTQNGVGYNNLLTFLIDNYNYANFGMGGGKTLERQKRVGQAYRVQLSTNGITDDRSANLLIQEIISKLSNA